MTKGDPESIRTAFQKLWAHCDQNKDGRVEFSELKSALAQGWAKQVAGDYASMLMMSADANNDGNISLVEWQNFFHRMWSDEVTEHIDTTMQYLLFGEASAVA